MAETLRIRSDLAAFQRKLAAPLARLPRATVAGINRSLAGANTLAVREIQRNLGTSAQKTIRRNLSAVKATLSNPEARLIAFSSKKERIPIYELKPSPRAVTRRRPVGGVRYGKNGKLLTGSFIGRMKSGHVGVFKRLTAKRLPIAELFGPSVARVFARPSIINKIRTFLKQSVPREINRALRFGKL